MKLLMENWRKYLNEAVSPGDAAMVAREVLQKVIDKKPFYPYPKKEVLGNDTLETFLRREAAQSRGRASDVFDMIKGFQKGYPEDEGAVKSELDALQVLLQLALKGRTHKRYIDELEANRIRYGYPDPEEQEKKKPQKRTQSIPAFSPEEISGDTQVFIPKESIIRENQNISEKEKTALKAQALLALVMNANHAGIDPPELYKLTDEDLVAQIELHNHNEEVSNEELFNFIRR